LTLEGDALEYAIQRSCAIKARIVAEDETETGVRALLNFGHTFGHAMETALEYRVWLHGEAVAAGMAVAADLSARLGRIDASAVGRINKLLLLSGLPTSLVPGLSVQRIRELMGVDKKSKSGRLRLILLDGIGSASIAQDVEEGLLLAALNAHTQAPP
jgi:3-dehydroquinate synthase